jgi:predicted nucleic acid-binding protein
MGSAYAESAMRDHERLKTEAGSRNSVIDEVARLLLPSFENFRTSGFMEFMPSTEAIWDSDPMDAAMIGSSICSSFVTPHNSIWLRLGSDEPELTKLQHIRLWYEQKTLLVHQRMYHALARFRPEANLGWAQLLCFGGQAMSIMPRRSPWSREEEGLAFRGEHIGKVFVDRDWQGNVMRSHRELELTAEAALHQWGDRLDTAPKVMEAARDPKKKHEKFEFIHRIEVNPKFELGRADKWGKAWHECYLSCADKEVVADSGTNAPSLIYSSFESAPGRKYAIGPGIRKLPDIRELQQLSLDSAVAVELSMLPGYGLHSDAQDNMIRIGPNELSYGLIDHRGNAMAQPIFSGGDIAPAEALRQRLSDGIKRAFFGNILEIDKELKTHITATDKLMRREDVGVVLDPLSLQEPEWFSPMVDRIVEILSDQGEFDDMPGEVREAGGGFAIGYDNPLTRARHAAEASGWFRLQEEAVKTAAVYPEALQELARLYPMRKVYPLIARALDVPVSIEATPEELEAYDAKMEQEKATQSALTTLPGVAGAVKDLSQAASFANAA